MVKEDYFVMVDHKALEAFLIQAYEKAGLPHDDAAVLSESLVRANLRGFDSHGVLLAPMYFKRMQMGGIDVETETQVISDTGCTAVIAGGNGVGQVVSYRAMQLAIEKAGQYGVGVVGARNSNHFGATGYWAMMALEHDMIGMAMTNTSPLMAPWGGTTPVLGSSPLAVAIPAGKEYPVVLDMATTMVAGGKLRIKAMREEKIPMGWAVGPDNEPTDDPNEALKGHILPLGGVCAYKGYGLALMVDILSAVLMGASFGTVPALDAKVRDLGHYFQAIKVSNFMSLEEFKPRVDTLLQQLLASELEPGMERVYYAGLREYLAEEERRSQGLPLDGPVYDNLEKMSEELGVPFNIRLS